MTSAKADAQDSLTSPSRSGKIGISPLAGGDLMTEEEAVGKLDSTPVERETYTAKQVATRVGTDAKTIRKFFRSKISTVEPVGQGGRYEFDAADLPEIKSQFARWNSNKTMKTPEASGNALPKKSALEVTIVEEDDDEELDPTDDDLAEIDELSLDEEEEE